MGTITDELTADIARRSAFNLAGDAECASPDTSDSPGADFLKGVRDSVLDQWESVDDIHEPNYAGTVHEIADAAVPIYTHNMWSAFVDLAAYQEDPTELGVNGSDMGQAAGVCLYMIAERLAYALFAEIAEAIDEDAANDETREVETDV